MYTTKGIVYADRRDRVFEVRDIPLTTEQIEQAGAKAAEGIPTAHTRKIRDASIVGKVEAIEAVAVPSDRPYEVGDLIAFRPSVNYGTRKWADIAYPVEIWKITKVSKETVQTSYGRISRDYILGRITEVA